VNQQPLDPFNPVLVLQAVAAGRAEQVSVVRAKLLFYDEHVIDLCHRICALYRMGGDTAGAVGQVGPLGKLMPMHLADAA